MPGSNRAGSVVMAREPIPLDTITTRGSVERRSSGMNARIIRTGPRTFVS